MKSLRYLAVSLALFLLAACQTGWGPGPVQAESLDYLVGQTKNRVIEMNGIPDRITYVGDKGYLYYTDREAKGMGVLVAAGPFPVFVFNKSTVGTDLYMIEFGPDKTVTRAVAYKRSPDLRYSLNVFEKGY
jgi:hypothetical protein